MTYQVLCIHAQMDHCCSSPHKCPHKLSRLLCHPVCQPLMPSNCFHTYSAQRQSLAVDILHWVLCMLHLCLGQRKRSYNLEERRVLQQTNYHKGIRDHLLGRLHSCLESPEFMEIKFYFENLSWCWCSLPVIQNSMQSNNDSKQCLLSILILDTH